MVKLISRPVSGNYLNVMGVRPLLGRPAELAAAIDAAIDGKNFDRLVEAPDSGRGMSQIGG